MEVGRVEVEKEVGGGGQSSQQQTDEPKMMEVEKDDVEKMVEKEKVEKMVGKEEVETMVEKEVEKMVETEEVDKMVETEKVETMVEKEEVEQMEVEPVHVDVVDEVDEVETVTAERSLQAKSACRPMLDLRRLQRGVLDESLPIGFLESGSEAVLSILTTNHDSETLLASTGWRPSGYVPTRAPLSDTSPADS